MWWLIAAGIALWSGSPEFTALFVLMWLTQD